MGQCHIKENMARITPETSSLIIRRCIAVMPPATDKAWSELARFITRIRRVAPLMLASAVQTRLLWSSKSGGLTSVLLPAPTDSANRRSIWQDDGPKYPRVTQILNLYSRWVRNVRLATVAAHRFSLRGKVLTKVG